MKRTTRRLLSILMTLCLFASLLCAGAYAVDVPEISCELGTALDYTIPQEGGNTATGYEFVSGSLPTGLSIELKDGAVKLVGTPGASGTYSYQLRITNASGTEEYSLTIKIIEPSPTPTPTPTPEPTPTPTPEPTPTPTPQPTPKPTPVPKPVITKDPTGETVFEGDYAIFIARADYADTIEWRIVNPNNDTDFVTARNVGNKFPGAYCEGYDEETLIVYNIRAEMDGWKAVCKFIGDGGQEYSKGAVITVVKQGLLPPSITRDPFVSSDSDTLSVTANDPNKGVLHYQWYSSTDNSNDNADGTDVAIAGANSPTFVPPETPGTVYYYCTVWSTLEGQKSNEAKSRVAAVTHAAQPTPEPTAEPTPEPVAVTPEPTPEARSSSSQSSGSRFLLILMGVLILALVAAAVALVIVSRRENMSEDDEEDEDEIAAPISPAKSAPVVAAASAAPVEQASSTAFEITSSESPAESEPSASDPDCFVLDGWYCKKCGSFNRGFLCAACGEKKPEGAIQYVCDHCGWTNPDPEHPPRFCPDCGTPFAAADENK